MKNNKLFFISICLSICINIFYTQAQQHAPAPTPAPKPSPAPTPAPAPAPAPATAPSAAPKPLPSTTPTQATTQSTSASPFAAVKAQATGSLGIIKAPPVQPKITIPPTSSIKQTPVAPAPRVEVIVQPIMTKPEQAGLFTRFTAWLGYQPAKQEVSQKKEALQTYQKQQSAIQTVTQAQQKISQSEQIKQKLLDSGLTREQLEKFRAGQTIQAKDTAQAELLKGYKERQQAKADIIATEKEISPSQTPTTKWWQRTTAFSPEDKFQLEQTRMAKEMTQKIKSSEYQKTVGEERLKNLEERKLEEQKRIFGEPKLMDKEAIRKAEESKRTQEYQENLRRTKEAQELGKKQTALENRILEQFKVKRLQEAAKLGKDAAQARQEEAAEKQRKALERIGKD